MKITKRQLNGIIKEEKFRLYKKKNIARDFGSNSTRRQVLKESDYQYKQEDEIEALVDHTGVTSITQRSGGQIEQILGQFYDRLDDINVSFETNDDFSPRFHELDPRLKGLIPLLDQIGELVFDAQMLAAHLAKNTGG